ncbi:MAG: hypothetical protein II823_06770 [Kiritimatiellae bacterium]|nr:hypothetical protein [Kiritimatiellia bacterium]
MLTPEQRAQVVQAMARITSMHYDLGEIGERLEEFADVEAIAAPCFHVNDVVLSISCARAHLDTANAVLDMFARPNEKEGK